MFQDPCRNAYFWRCRGLHGTHAPVGEGPPDVMTFPDSNFLGLRLHHGQELIGMGNALNNACMGVMALPRAFHKRTL